MLTERSPTQHTSSTSISLELNALFEKTNINALLQEQTIAEFGSKHLQTLMQEIAPKGPMSSSEPIKSSEQEQVELDPYPESDYQWLLDALETLSDIVSRNVNNGFAALTEADYEQLDAVLKELIYTVGDDEKHPLAPLMDFIGVLITKYEDEHFPKLTELFPELAENVNSNDIKDENQQDNPTKAPEKPTSALAAETFFSIGNLLSEGDKKEGAIFAYDQATYLNPEHTHAYYNRGRAKGGLGQYKAAIADFDETIRLEPDNAKAYFGRGYAKYGMGEYNSAIADFDETIRLEPDNAQAYNNRGHLKNRLGQYKSALTDCNKSIQLNSNDPWSYANRGFAKINLGQPEPAITDCDEAIRLNPSLAEAYETRGKANALLGRTQEAKADFQKALDLAEQTGNQGLKTEIGQSLKELDNTE